MRIRPPTRLVALGVAILSLSCANTTGPIVITGFYPLKLAAGVCSADTSGGQEEQGVFDSNSGAGYLAGVELTNQLASNATAYMTTTDIAYVDSAVLTYQKSGTGTLQAPASQNIALSGAIQPGDAADLVATLLSAEAAATASFKGKSGNLLIDVSFKGHFEDGSTWSTAPVTFPVQVCNTAGCGGCANPTATCSDKWGQPDGETCPTAAGG